MMVTILGNTSTSEYQNGFMGMLFFIVYSGLAVLALLISLIEYAINKIASL